MAFNKTVGVDCFEHFAEAENQTANYFNMICWGTARQSVERLLDVEKLPPTAAESYQAFLAGWVRFYGWPELVVAGLGSEFVGKDFVDMLRQHGVHVHFIDRRSPWQNSMTERAGGLWKEHLTRALADAAVTTPEEYRLAAMETTAARNRHYDKSGFFARSTNFRTFSTFARPNRVLGLR